MKGDFSRLTYDPDKHYIRVLLQQGRVQIDADSNEQAAILLHYLQTLARDLIGEHGGPAAGELGFLIETDEEEILGIGPGHYYVAGILCENDDQDLTYTSQQDYPSPPELSEDDPFLVYLDVWERHITFIQDDQIREVALGGPDTATRSKLVWQVKATNEPIEGQPLPDTPIDPDTNEEVTWPDWVAENWETWVDAWQPEQRGTLKAKCKEDPEADTDPCITSPEARYRGPENQLYRVEIQRGGTGWDGQTGRGGAPAGNARTAATFKWSRDNGSVVFPILQLTPSGETTTVELANLGRDDRGGLEPGDWVEIVDDEAVLHNRVEPLLKVESVDRVNMQVTLQGALASLVGQVPSKHPLLRRWDHREGDPEEGGLQLHEGAALLQEGSGTENWLILEAGVQVQFPNLDEDGNPIENTYRKGDYWLIPARVATGDVEWPGPVGEPFAEPPHGVQHHYAPLAIVNPGTENPVNDLRRKFDLVWEH